MQLAGGEWVLGVQIQQFENPRDSEIRNGLYCCCDFDVLCQESLSDLQMCVHTQSNHRCDNYFVVYARACSYNSTCSYTKPHRQRSDDISNQLVRINLETGLSEKVHNKSIITYQI